MEKCGDLNEAVCYGGAGMHACYRKKVECIEDCQVKAKGQLNRKRKAADRGDALGALAR